MPTETADCRTFKLRLRAIRQKRKMTQIELARVLELPVSTVCRYETGRLTPGLERAATMARRLGIRLDSLVETR